jgi:serine/threonine protein phosphatase 1
LARHLAIGDIHGCFNSLRTLVDFVGVNSDDTLITLGDYVDRGPNTNAILDWMIRHHANGQVIPLRGNHEIMMLNARDDDESHQIWLDVGGRKALESYAPSDGGRGQITDIPETHWQFLENDLLATYETHRNFFVHANAYPNIPLDEQPDFMLYWEPFNYPAAHESGKIMVCGHTSQKSGLPRNHNHAICIDTWACGRGWLTCLDVESGIIWQANEAGDTRRMFIDDLDSAPA